MKKIILTALSIFFLVSCGGTNPQPEDKNNYLYFTSINKASDVYIVKGTNKNGEFIELETSNDKISWTKIEDQDQKKIKIGHINVGETLYIRGNNPSGFSKSDKEYYSFDLDTGSSLTDKVEIGGNIMSLVFDKDFDNKIAIPCDYCFYKFINGSDLLRTANNFLLPATELKPHCYEYMFAGCQSLETYPSLPANTLADYCYKGMFRSCTMMESHTAPVLNAMELAPHCYEDMFSECWNLSYYPSLPAMALKEACYRGMFSGCSDLGGIGGLPAVELQPDCYSNMFFGCQDFSNPPVLKATQLKDGCYYAMFYNCVSLYVKEDYGPEDYKFFTCPDTTGISHPVDDMFYNCGWYHPKVRAGHSYYRF